ncbi:hypothetical protein [Thiosulfatihalobacter marinus]|uniref:hypothetical protein n=1 Tax=Thiosulfatihalobacter marinus TaxID=2792481 RepID=UPI0018D8F757|nr:hypothetical protein [Thiosulfatihalobacter marinus]
MYPNGIERKLARLFPHYGWAHMFVSLVISVAALAVALVLSRALAMPAIYVLAVVVGPMFYAGREFVQWKMLDRFDRRGFWWPVTGGLIALALIWALTASSASAQANCLPSADLAAALRAKYGESVTGSGLTRIQGGVPALLQVWISPESGTFTVVIVRASGLACVMAAGENWMVMEPLAPPDDPT